MELHSCYYVIKNLVVLVNKKATFPQYKAIQ